MVQEIGGFADEDGKHTYNLLVLSVIGYLIIVPVVLVAIIMDEDPGKILSVLLFGIGAIMNLAAGIICFITYSDRKDYSYGGYDNTGSYLALGITTIICGALMLVDVILNLLDK